MNQNKSNQSLGEGSINRLMLRFSIPCVLSLLISSLYNLVDQMFIGNSSLSTLGNAATGVVFPVFIISQAFAWSLGDGCAAYLNIFQGKNEDEGAHHAIGGSITVALLCGLLMIAVITPIKEPMLMLFGATENTIAYAIEYLDIVLVMMPAYILCNTLNSVIRADGSPAWAMTTILVGAITNIILDPVFIFGLDMGMTGAALATVIGQGVSFLATVAYFFRTKTFRLTRASFLPRLSSIGRIMGLGSSTFVTQIAIVVVAILCNVQFAKYGAMSEYGADIPIAIIGIESKVFTVVINLVVGVVLGCQPIISYNMGAGNYDRVRVLYKRIMVLALAVGLAFTLLFELAPRFIVGLFGVPSNIPNPQAYWEFGEKTMRIFLSLITVSCMVKTNSIFFQAAGKPGFAVVSSMVREVLCFVPLVLILPCISPSVELLLYAAPISDLISMAITACLSIVFLRSLKGGEDSANLTEKEDF